MHILCTASIRTGVHSIRKMVDFMIFFYYRSVIFSFSCIQQNWNIFVQIGSLSDHFLLIVDGLVLYEKKGRKEKEPIEL